LVGVVLSVQEAVVSQELAPEFGGAQKRHPASALQFFERVVHPSRSGRGRRIVGRHDHACGIGALPGPAAHDRIYEPSVDDFGCLVSPLPFENHRVRCKVVEKALEVLVLQCPVAPGLAPLVDSEG
jgi:hypothetical protein